MSINKKKSLFPTLIFFVPLVLAACFPLGGEDVKDYRSEIGEVGEPQVSCSEVGEVKLSYPISPVVSSGHNEIVHFFISPSDFLVSSPEWSSNNVSWTLDAPKTPTDVSLDLSIGWEVYFDERTSDRLKGREEREDTVTLPTCDFEAASPPEEEGLGDGIPVIQSAMCDVGRLEMYIDFPEAVDGLNSSYEAFINGERLFLYPNGTSLLGVLFSHPESNPATFLLRSLPFHNVVLETEFEWQECMDNPDGEPFIYNATCLKGTHLMVAFEFPEPVTGQYEAAIDGQVYQYTPVADYPNRAYFFGPPPRYQGPASVSLSTIPDGEVVFEQQDYEFPVCGVQKPKDDDGSGHYVPPSY
jgi:hypothetical protein